MNKTQSLDGIIGPHHAHGMPGARRLKAEAAQSVCRAYKHVIARELDDMKEPELDDMNEVDPEIVDAQNNHGQDKPWYQRDSDAKNLLEEVILLMAAHKVTPDQVKYVNHSCGSMPWSDFVEVAGRVTFYESCYSVYDLDDLFAVVGPDWWIGVIHSGDGECLGLRRLPALIPYYVAPKPEFFNWPEHCR